MTTDQFNDIIEDIMTSTWESGKNKIINLCKQMCDKQKEICYEEGETKDVGSGYQAYYVIDKESIINAPYPEELL